MQSQQKELQKPFPMKITECPRDAMQGIGKFIPTERKISYLNRLLQVGFDVLDFGSFVSPKAIPQLRDTAEVLAGLDLSNTSTKLLAIVANLRGAQEACKHEEIFYLGFPFSVSETFQQRNTNKSIEESLKQLQEIQSLCLEKNKHLVVYLSMAFGNPFNDPWSLEVVMDWAHRLSGLGIKTLALSDTIGSANPENISTLFSGLIPALPEVEFTAHLHTTPTNWHANVSAAYDAGCRSFDTAIKGFGGCPMAKDELTGNLATEKLLSFMEERKINHQLNPLQFESAINEAIKTFPTH